MPRKLTRKLSKKLSNRVRKSLKRNVRKSLKRNVRKTLKRNVRKTKRGLRGGAADEDRNRAKLAHLQTKVEEIMNEPGFQKRDVIAGDQLWDIETEIEGLKRLLGGEGNRPTPPPRPPPPRTFKLRRTSGRQTKYPIRGSTVGMEDEGERSSENDGRPPKRTKFWGPDPL